MKVVHITTSNKGGAGIAALRLHQGLLERGVDSSFLSLYQFPSQVKAQYLFRKRDTATIPILVDTAEFIGKILRKMKLISSEKNKFEKKYLKGRSANFEHFSFPFSELDILEHALVKNADIVHLHWVSDGFLDYEKFFTSCKKNIIWTLHDMNPFTGGCHHSDNCLNFISDCKNCPQLKGTINENYAEELLKIKENALQHIDKSQMKIVAPSQWLTNLSSQSKLFAKFSHLRIPNLSNVFIFKIRNKNEVRKKMNIPVDKKVILFVAHSVSNVRKGAHLLAQALEKFGPDKSMLVCSVGSIEKNRTYKLEQLDLGYVTDEITMAEIYAAADVFVLPSIAENFPNTICESLLCGTPVVAFNVGGISELITERNGKLVEPYDVDKLHDAINFILKNQSNFDSNLISHEACEQLHPDFAVKKYIDLYSSMPSDND